MDGHRVVGLHIKCLRVKRTRAICFRSLYHIFVQIWCVPPSACLAVSIWST